MDWSHHLAAGEAVVWEGRPAPRCYVFRNWRHSIFGVLLLLLSTWWQAVGYQLGQLYESAWLVWVPLPFVLLGLYMAIGHLLLARLEWEHVFYALTDRQVLVRRGLFRRRVACLPLGELDYFQLRPLGEQLGTLRVSGARWPHILTLCCIEHPRRLTDHLEAALKESGKEVPVEQGAS